LRSQTNAAAAIRAKRMTSSGTTNSARPKIMPWLKELPLFTGSLPSRIAGRARVIN